MSKITSKTKKKINPVEIFIGAIANEMNRDCYIFHKSPISQYTNLIIPRLEKLNYLASTHPRLLAFVTFVAYIIWPIFLYPVLLLFQATLVLRHTSLQRVKITGDIFFSTSKTSFLLSRSSGFKGVHICLSKRLKQFNPLANSTSCITDHVALSDIVCAFLYSVRALFYIKRSSNKPGIMFQNYCAFDWFLTWIVLDQNSNSLRSVWMSNDSDRWAVLIDQLITGANKIIVQHGLLSDPPNTKGFRNPESLPRRLENIHKIILFDKESEDDYRTLVIKKNSNVCFIYSGGSLIQKAPDLDDSATVRVMIIGQRVQLEEECALANYLVEVGVNSLIFIKPHPSSNLRYYKKKLDMRVVLIKDIFEFPYIDMCICFDFSSLAYLYEKQGTEVIYLSNLENNRQYKEKIRVKINDFSRKVK